MLPKDDQETLSASRHACVPCGLLTNPVWQSLHGNHRHLGAFSNAACRYQADVAPFAAIESPSEAALSDLARLLVRGESVWVICDRLPRAPGLLQEATLPCLQMWLPQAVPAPTPDARAVPLSCEDAAEMVALTSLAFPGFFRLRTCAMGHYFGIRSPEGALVAMAGERLYPGGLPEISGVCTHPDFRGRGFAASLIWAVILRQRRQGLQPWLYVTAGNQGAVSLYRRMGFETMGEATLHRITKNSEHVSE